MATVLITGGTGMIGTRLSEMLLEKNYDVIILSHNPSSEKNKKPKILYAAWNIEESKIDKDAFAKADYIIHLAGAGVADKRWTKKRRHEIVESRTKSSALLVFSLKSIPNKVKAVVSASAIGWYGEDNLQSQQKGFKEDDSAADNFLADTCKAWEKSIQPVKDAGKRLVILRTGIVLSNKGGAYAEFKKPLHAGIAAILGSGKQIISWIHVDDICRMYICAMENENLNGVYNAVAPMPVSNKELTLMLAKKMRGKLFMSMHVPAFGLKMMLGELSTEVLKSATVSADKIRQAGFTFLYPSLQSALEQLTAEK